MNFAAAPNPAPDGSNWTVVFGGMTEDGENADDPMEGVVGVVALTEDTDDLPGVTEIEHRFRLLELSDETPIVVYVGGCLHRHSEDVEEGCEVFEAEDGQADLDDLPEDLEQILVESMEFEVYPPGDEPVDAEPVEVADVVGPDSDPGGMYQ